MFFLPGRGEKEFVQNEILVKTVVIFKMMCYNIMCLQLRAA